MQSKIHKDENRGGSTACAGRTRTRSGVGGGVGAAAAPPGASLQSLYQLTMQLNPEGTHTQAKVGRRPTQTFLQGRHTDGQEADEKMLNRTNY